MKASEGSLRYRTFQEFDEALSYLTALPQ
jgi:hypothetical protein